VFAIQLLPPSVRGSDGERIGRITVGRFTELFGCYPPRGQSARSMAAQWRAQLRRLVGGQQPAVALVTGEQRGSCFVSVSDATSSRDISSHLRRARSGYGGHMTRTATGLASGAPPWMRSHDSSTPRPNQAMERTAGSFGSSPAMKFHFQPAATRLPASRRSSYSR